MLKALRRMWFSWLEQRAWKKVIKAFDKLTLDEKRQIVEKLESLRTPQED